MATCKGCGAEIIWAITGSGKKIPLDVATHEKRFILKLPQGEHAEAQMVETYLSHFATCPQAANFRRPRDGSA